MLPRIPDALCPDFIPIREQDSRVETEVDHHCQICPTCGSRLQGHRCKLICTRCGYYLSCADYY